ncbi:hypothetical protein conserved [Leishmania donovani]|uniref:Uncharacterized protein n=3 Tax=Leishmania donovani species complex TaxID=38574 RepID=A4I5R6_LEIIN|nr:conserved hypothetical protein [Leishmania infantum JPCM5]XP_003862951.1 hypothetical protein, conserved [Leishmania donovani]CAC9514667.1 hypothetical_protein_-_conserved [Leishmania infantum]AYU81038.1 hypothetical protein LdCL_300029400 [Leishmania donovani]TPP43288.1 hypothetical protein CGC20_6610 [Leishmania donovani]TPP45798.1 hypothetical protein CGC21_35945 [Leishmania donovani]CAJ1991031.1 hypothetical protein conserved [Leishmania donovani]|eukprot:XP_001467085.1 conserved hypothetical protein [Leishmania infantum JPCM5]
MSAHDSSAVVLIAHMNDIERQRRVLSMSQREQEAKIAFTTAEKEQLVQAAKAAEAEEAQLKDDLEVLAAEQQQLELQKMEATDRLRKTQAEEALHTAAIEVDLQTLAKEKVLWHERAQDLESLRRSWEEDAATSSCIGALRQESEMLALLKTEKTAVEDALAETMAAIEKVRAEQQARLTCVGPIGAAADAVQCSGLARALASMHDSALSDGNSATVNDDDSAAALEEEMKRADYEAAQATARHGRTIAVLQREVDALSTRAGELQQLLSSIGASRQEVLSRTRDLQHCKETGLCRRCFT